MKLPVLVPSSAVLQEVLAGTLDQICPNISGVDLFQEY